MMLTRAAKADLCRYFPIGALTRGMEGEELADFGTLQAAGCVAFSDDGKSVMNAAIMRRALKYTAWIDAPVVAHEEDTNLSGKGYMNEGPVSACLGCLGIPSAAEEVMVARDLVLAEYTGGHLHLAHLSTKSSITPSLRAHGQGTDQVRRQLQDESPFAHPGRYRGHSGRLGGWYGGRYRHGSRPPCLG
jgi:dihydroorotase